MKEMLEFVRWLQQVSFPRTNKRPLDQSILSVLYNTYMSVRVLSLNSQRKTKSKFFQNNLNIVQSNFNQDKLLCALRNS